MKGYLRLQATLFGVFNENKRIHKDIERLIEKLDFDTFLKSVNCHSEFDRDDNVSLIGSKSGIEIMIANNRVDVLTGAQVNNIDNSVSGFELDRFLKYAKMILSYVVEHYKTEGNRISIVTSKLIDEQYKEKVSKLISDSIYKKDEIFEWSTRTAVRSNLVVGDNDESLNIITTFDLTSNNIILGHSSINLAGLIMGFDINTVPENKNYRINANFINHFYDEIIKEVQKLEVHYK